MNIKRHINKMISISLMQSIVIHSPFLQWIWNPWNRCEALRNLKRCLPINLMKIGNNCFLFDLHFHSSKWKLIYVLKEPLLYPSNIWHLVIYLAKCTSDHDNPKTILVLFSIHLLSIKIQNCNTNEWKPVDYGTFMH